MLRHAPYYVREAGYWMAALFVRKCVPMGAVEPVLGICGIWCLLTPLLLWVAWTEFIFFFLLGSAASACTIFCIVAVGASDREKRLEEAEALARKRPPDALSNPAPSSRRGSLPTWRDHA